MPLNIITDTELSRAGILWVVLSKDHSTVLQDPGLSRAWSTTNKKIAEDTAHECGGHALPLREAIRIISNDRTGKNYKAVEKFVKAMQDAAEGR